MNSDELKRVPIVLNSRCIALLHLFHKKENFEDLWMLDEETVMNSNYEIHANAAKQFVEQLQDHWSELFMSHLIKESFERMINFNPKNGYELIKELQQIQENRMKKERGPDWDPRV